MWTPALARSGKYCSLGLSSRFRCSRQDCKPSILRTPHFGKATLDLIVHLRRTKSINLSQNRYCANPLVSQATVSTTRTTRHLAQGITRWSIAMAVIHFTRIRRALSANMSEIPGHQAEPRRRITVHADIQILAAHGSPGEHRIRAGNCRENGLDRPSDLIKRVQTWFEYFDPHWRLDPRCKHVESVLDRH